MRLTQIWLDDERIADTPSLTRRAALAGSLKLLGGGALALTLAAAPARSAFAQDDGADDGDDAAEGEAAGDIQVGTTDDAAAADGEAAAGAELPAVAGETEADREARRAARQAEEGVGAVATVPSTGVGAALGSSLSGVSAAIGLAAAMGAAAFFTRRPPATDDATG